MGLTRSYWPADTSEPVLETTLGGVLRETAALTPGGLALVAGLPDPAARRWRFAELLAEAEGAARALAARFAPGERVAVWAPNIPQWVMLEFGAVLAGLTLVTVNPAYRLSRIPTAGARVRPACPLRRLRRTAHSGQSARRARRTPRANTLQMGRHPRSGGQTRR